MHVRGDLREVEAEVVRLVSIGAEFRTNDHTWSHLKNREDWEEIYSVEDFDARTAFERVYEAGRDMASFMSFALVSINTDFKTFLTLTSIIEHFRASWVHQDLSSIPTTAENEASRLDFRNWALDQMIAEFRSQLSLLDAVRQALELLRRSNTYKRENGMPENQSSASISISHISNSAIAVQSPDATVNTIVNTQLFADLETVLVAAGVDRNGSIVESVREMAAQTSPAELLPSYTKFLSLVADHMQVVQPFLPQLAALLVGS